MPIVALAIAMGVRNQMSKFGERLTVIELELRRVKERGERSATAAQTPQPAEPSRPKAVAPKPAPLWTEPEPERAPTPPPPLPQIVEERSGEGTASMSQIGETVEQERTGGAAAKTPGGEGAAA